MRIAWAIPCVRVRVRDVGLLDLLGAQIDSVVVDSLPKDVQFDVAIRLIGTVQDFEVDHVVEVVLSSPDLIEIGRLQVPVAPRAPAPTHIPGYEINHAVAVRIDFPAEMPGGYDLSFALDGEAAHWHKTTVSVILAE